MLRLEKDRGRWQVLDEGHRVIERFPDTQAGLRAAKALVRHRNAAEARKKR